MPWTIEKRDDKYCVVKEDSREVVPGGCHPTQEEAAAHLGAIEANYQGGKSEWITIEQMREVCPSCADEMEKKGFTRVKQGNIEGLAQHIFDQYGGDPGLFTKCMDLKELSEYDEEIRARICARVHLLVEGKWPGESSGKEPVIEYKSTPMHIEQIEDRVVKQLFAVHGHVDEGNDKIFNGAWKKTLAERMARVKVFWQHNADWPPIGKPLLLKEINKDELPADYKAKYPTATGALYGEVKYLDTDRGNEILSGIREGVITENSVGYDALQYDYVTEGERKVRQLKELRLWDISPVNWGMQPLAINLKNKIMQFHAGEFDLDKLVFELTRAYKEGRVLSGRNLERLKNALTTLNEILFSAEPPEDEEKLLALTQVLRQKVEIAEREYLLL